MQHAVAGDCNTKIPEQLGPGAHEGFRVNLQGRGGGHDLSSCGRRIVGADVPDHVVWDIDWADVPDHVVWGLMSPTTIVWEFFLGR